RALPVYEKPPVLPGDIYCAKKSAMRAQNKGLKEREINEQRLQSSRGQKTDQTVLVYNTTVFTNCPYFIP
ncbi:MAG TPA: hypothetical protein PLV03_06535, partial [Clostridiales bacterium]|nr:hypothetical protein [Clostridiales bacterium]